MRPEEQDRAPVTSEEAVPEQGGEVRVPIIEEEVTVRRVPRVKEEIIIRVERETVMEEREVEIRRERIEVVAEGDVDLEAPEDLLRRSP